MTAITPENASERIAEVMLPDVYPIIIDLERSSGNRLFDSRGKRTYLDCFSYVASNPVGHNHPLMFDAEFERKLLRSARSKPSSSDFYTLEKAEFVETFRRLCMPEGMNHLFLVEGGAVAVENAMKAAFDWKIRLNQSRGEAGEKGTKIIHFREAFHGRCGYTLSVTNTADPRKTKFFPKFDWPRITNPKMRFPQTADAIAEVEALEKQALAEIDAAYAEHGTDIAAILIETIQGEGGDNHFRPEFLRSLRRIADERDTLLIFDEIQCGGGATGTMWAWQGYGVTPDIICFGKKFQVCGIVVSKRIEEVEHHVFAEASRINSTWGGSLVDMVRATRYLEIVERERLLENAASVGKYFLERLAGLAAGAPQQFSNPRGRGMYLALDVVNAKLRDGIVQETFKQGAIILRCGVSSLRFRPSLTFSRAEVDELVEILERATNAASA